MRDRLVSELMEILLVVSFDEMLYFGVSANLLSPLLLSRLGLFLSRCGGWFLGRSKVEILLLFCFATMILISGDLYLRKLTRSSQLHIGKCHVWCFISDIGLCVSYHHILLTNFWLPRLQWRPLRKSSTFLFRMHMYKVRKLCIIVVLWWLLYLVVL